MSKYFLGSVGSAEAFRNTAAGRQLAFVCKTLTDSSINISTTKDDLRGGTGAPIVTNFYHDPNVEITLTDIFWKESYLEAQLGAMFQAGSEIKSYFTEPEELEASNNDGYQITLTKEPLALPVACDKETKATVWFAKTGSDTWQTAEVTEHTKIIPVPGAGKYCVRYLATDEQAREAVITSNIIPEELFLIITTPIFFGDACSTSNGKLAGSLTFEIPRFKLNGAQNFSFNMSSNTTMELSGTALADFSGCDMINGQLVRIIETLDGRKLNDDIVALAFDGGKGYAAGANIPIMVIYDGGAQGKLTWATQVANASNAVANSIYITNANYSNDGYVTLGNADQTVTATFYPTGANGTNFSTKTITIA